MAIKKDDDSLLLKHLGLRTGEFRRNEDLDCLLEELGEHLGSAESAIESQFDGPSLPPLFLVGNPRSGTSLFMQFLSRLQCFAVPTNLLSRFYYAPFIGAKIQELLTNPKYDYKNELGNKSYVSGLSSDIGKAEGMLAPSEFFHFWRRFLPKYDPQYLDDNDQRNVDLAGLRKGVAAIEAVFNQPFAAKAIILQYNLDVLSAAFSNSLIIYLRREPQFVMQSIMLARKRFYGDINVWWSVKPKEYVSLKDMDVYHQIAGQVYYTERALDSQLIDVDENRKLIVNYEEFCVSPKLVAEKIEKKYQCLGFPVSMNLGNTWQLKTSKELKIAPSEMRSLEKAYEHFQSLYSHSAY